MIAIVARPVATMLISPGGRREWTAFGQCEEATPRTKSSSSIFAGASASVFAVRGRGRSAWQ